MFDVTFNNISVISWRPVLLVEETGVPGENHRPAASHWQTLSNIVVSSRIRTHNVTFIHKFKQHLIERGYKEGELNTII